MTAIRFTGGPYDGRIQEHLEGGMLDRMFVPYEGKYFEYRENFSVDDEGRPVVEFVGQVDDLTEMFPPKETIASRAHSVMLLSLPYGLALSVLDQAGAEITGLQLAAYQPEMATWQDALDASPAVLEKAAGVRVTSDWEEGHFNGEPAWRATVERIES